MYKLSAEGREFYKLCDFVHNFTMDIITRRKKKLVGIYSALLIYYNPPPPHPH